jgi:SAM-dependent methyltransferase
MFASVSGDIPLDDRRTLNLGSGKEYDATAVNVDITPDTRPDIVHDLDVIPWPFDDNRFERVRAIDVLEHLDDALAAMDEIHRVCRSGAIVEIALPHFSAANAYSDLTHRRAFGYFSFDPITGESIHDFYSRRRFSMLRREITFYHRPINRLVRHLANRYPREYEQRWAWIFPAWFISFELEVQKNVGPRGYLT